MKNSVYLIVGLFIMVSCQDLEQTGDNMYCPQISLIEEAVYFDRPVSGFNCKEFERRQEYESSPCARPYATIDEESTNTKIENAIVPGVQEGSNIALNSSHMMSIQEGYLVFNHQNNPEDKVYLSSTNPQFVVEWKEKFLVFGARSIELYNPKGRRAHSWEFEGRIKTYLRGDELIVFETKDAPTSEDECRRIQYTSNEKFSGITKTSKINLNSLQSTESSEIIYGWTIPHVDQNGTYLLDSNWKNSYIYKLGEHFSAKNITGMILNQTAVREYGDELHLVKQLPHSGGAQYQVLNDVLEEIQSLDVVAPGESLRAAHFTEDLVYFATFLNSDPLFLVDPKNPQYLSELTYPGTPIHLQEIGEDFILSLNRVGWEERSKLNLINKADTSTVFIDDVLSLDSGFWSFTYHNFLVQNNFIFLKDYYGVGYLIELTSDSELRMVKNFERIEIGFFQDNEFIYFENNNWESITLD